MITLKQLSYESHSHKYECRNQISGGVSKLVTLRHRYPYLDLGILNPPASRQHLNMPCFLKCPLNVENSSDRNIIDITDSIECIYQARIYS